MIMTDHSCLPGMHLYPTREGHEVEDGARCRCGKKMWGQSRQEDQMAQKGERKQTGTGIPTTDVAGMLKEIHERLEGMARSFDALHAKVDDLQADFDAWLMEDGLEDEDEDPTRP